MEKNIVEEENKEKKEKKEKKEGTKGKRVSLFYSIITKYSAYFLFIEYSY